MKCDDCQEEITFNKSRPIEQEDGKILLICTTCSAWRLVDRLREAAGMPPREEETHEEQPVEQCATGCCR